MSLDPNQSHKKMKFVQFEVPTKHQNKIGSHNRTPLEVNLMQNNITTDPNSIDRSNSLVFKKPSNLHISTTSKSMRGQFQTEVSQPNLNYNYSSSNKKDKMRLKNPILSPNVSRIFGGVMMSPSSVVESRQFSGMPSINKSNNLSTTIDAIKGPTMLINQVNIKQAMRN